MPPENSHRSAGSLALLRFLKRPTWLVYYDRLRSANASFDGESGHARLVRELYLFWIPAQVATIGAGLVSGVMWRWPPGLVLAGLAVLAGLETRIQLRRGSQSLTFSIMLDTGLIGVGLYFVQVPYLAMSVPFLTVAVTAVMLLPLKRAVWVCGYIALVFGLVVTASVQFDRPPLTGTEGALVGSIATLVFFGLLLRLIWMVQRIISENFEQRQEDAKGWVSANNQLIASVSHEIRTPLAAVVGFIELLAESSDAMSEAEKAEMLILARDQGRELSNQVDDFVVAARSKAGSLQILSVPVDIGDQVARVLDSWPDPAASFITTEGLPAAVIGDPSRIGQILRNLVSNALQYGGERIGIEVHQDGTSTYVTVWDDGNAIPMDQRERIFEAFTRGATQVTAPLTIGLGLSISRDLARQMGGDLRYSFSMDRSRFELSLPSVPAVNPTITEPSDAKQAHEAVESTPSH